MSLIVRAAIIWLGVLSTSSFMQPVFAKEPDVGLERQVKSAYIFKFGNYIQWPDKAFAGPSSPIIIGVIEDEPIAEELEKIAARHSSANRKVVIKRMNEKNINEDVHILYIAQDANKFLTAYRNANPLTSTVYITDSVDGLAVGSNINFVRDNDRLRFDVSLLATEQNNIKLDASLLTVARQVIK